VFTPWLEQHLIGVNAALVGTAVCIGNVISPNYVGGIPELIASALYLGSIVVAIANWRIALRARRRRASGQNDVAFPRT
jgi:hypothetical protein